MLNYNDYDIINECMVNEEFSFNDIKNKIVNLKNKNKTLKELLNKFNNMENIKSKFRLLEMIVILYIFINIGFLPKIEKDFIHDISNMLYNKEYVSDNDLDDILKNSYVVIEDQIIHSELFKNVDELRTSEYGRRLIKKHEGLRLEAYDLGDGKITIGYGHSQLKSESKYRVGDKITSEKAEKLFNQDILYFEKSVKRIFRQWSDNGIDIYLTQGMFDAMVSMAYNMGVTRLRQSDFIQYLKNGNYEEASKEIEYTALNSRFPGLKTRRQSEKELFKKTI